MKGRVLLISPSFRESTGGVQKVMQEIFERSSFTINVLTEEYTNDEKIKNINIKGLKGILQVNKYIWKRRDSIDLVYVSTATRLHLLLLPIILGMGTVCHAHGRDLYLSYSSVKEIVQGLISALLRRIGVQFIAVSKWTKRQLIEMGVSRCRVQTIPNGVDVDRFKNVDSGDVRRRYGIGEDDFLLLTVARLDPRKGHRLVIRSLKNEKNCYYLIVGKGEFMDELRTLSAENDVSDRVIFAGYVPDDELPKIYHSCDLFIMPSEHLEDSNNVEGFGISFLEANASGKAVIGTRTGGIPTAIQHEHNGYLCDPNKESVLRSIRKLKNNPKLLRKLEQNAIRWAEKHDWSRIVSLIDHVIDKEINS